MIDGPPRGAAGSDPAAFDLAAYSYDLPDDQIAQHPVEPRHAARLLAVPPTGPFADLQVTDLPDALVRLFGGPPLLVVNDTRVVAARLRARKATGGAVELLLERPFGGRGDALDAQPVIYRAGKALRSGDVLAIDGGASATVRSVAAGGRAVVDLAGAPTLSDLLDHVGHVPLPPYIRGGVDLADVDRARYQCTYARAPGAVAAPTAGLHLSAELLRALDAAGIERTAVTLHVGPGTFLPVRSDDLRSHRVESERFELGAAAALAIARARQSGRAVVAVGTTTARVLEHVASIGGGWQARSGEAELTILPGHRFAAIDGLVSNFHLPRSSLIVLVAAFAGRERVLAAYRHAVAAGYRFYSYGDASVWVGDRARARVQTTV